MNILRVSKAALVLAIGIVTFFGGSLVSAQNNTNTGPVNTGTSTQTTTAASKGIFDFNASNPVGTDAEGLVQRVLTILLGLIASVSIIFIIIGGFRLVFSQGSSDAVTAGRKTITWAVGGLVLALLAFVLLRAVVAIIS